MQIAAIENRAVAALGFSIDGFDMPNQTINCSIKVSLQIYAVFSLLQPKNLMGSANPSLKIDGFGRTHANATTDIVGFGHSSRPSRENCSNNCAVCKYIFIKRLRDHECKKLRNAKTTQNK